MTPGDRLALQHVEPGKLDAPLCLPICADQFDTGQRMNAMIVEPHGPMDPLVAKIAPACNMNDIDLVRHEHLRKGCHAKRKINIIKMKSGELCFIEGALLPTTFPYAHENTINAYHFRFSRAGRRPPRD